MCLRTLRKLPYTVGFRVRYGTMERSWLSVEQVAETLGLHVRTVRGYIRNGRLKAVRIGKQYRIAKADLDAFTGRPGSPVRSQRAEVSTVVEFEGIDAVAADRLSTLLVAGAQMPRDAGDPLHVRAVYDDTRSRLKVIILGGLSATAKILQVIEEVLGAENGMFLTDDTEGPT
jgi:excisionase family DNA binding protein